MSRPQTPSRGTRRQSCPPMMQPLPRTTTNLNAAPNSVATGPNGLPLSWPIPGNSNKRSRDEVDQEAGPTSASASRAKVPRLESAGAMSSSSISTTSAFETITMNRVPTKFYEQNSLTIIEYTIDVYEWDNYVREVKISKIWINKRFAECTFDTQIKRLQDISLIVAITKLGQGSYFLCMPPERRPEYLPRMARDASRELLRVIVALLFRKHVMTSEEGDHLMFAAKKKATQEMRQLGLLPASVNTIESGKKTQSPRSTTPKEKGKEPELPTTNIQHGSTQRASSLPAGSSSRPVFGTAFPQASTGNRSSSLPPAAVPAESYNNSTLSPTSVASLDHSVHPLNAASLPDVSSTTVRASAAAQTTPEQPPPPHATPGGPSSIPQTTGSYQREVPTATMLTTLAPGIPQQRTQSSSSASQAIATAATLNLNNYSALEHIRLRMLAAKREQQQARREDSVLLEQQLDIELQRLLREEEDARRIVPA